MHRRVHRRMHRRMDRRMDRRVDRRVDRMHRRLDRRLIRRHVRRMDWRLYRGLVRRHVRRMDRRVVRLRFLAVRLRLHEHVTTVLANLIDIDCGVEAHRRKAAGVLVETAGDAHVAQERRERALRREAARVLNVPDGGRHGAADARRRLVPTRANHVDLRLVAEERERAPVEVGEVAKLILGLAKVQEGTFALCWVVADIYVNTVSGQRPCPFFHSLYFSFFLSVVPAREVSSSWWTYQDQAEAIRVSLRSSPL